MGREGSSSSNPETMVVVSCWSVDKLGERELLWKRARMAFVTVADCLVCSFPVYIPYRGSACLPIRERKLFFFSLFFSFLFLSMKADKKQGIS